jgi:hypothetical protein
VTENYRVRFQAGRDWPSVSLRLPAAFSDHIKSIRIDGRTVRAGDSVVTILPFGDMNIAVEYNLDPVTFSASPQSIVFALSGNDTTTPAPKTVRVTPSSASAFWNAYVSDSWLSIDRTSGAGSQDITVSINHISFEGGRTTGSVFIRQQGGGEPLAIPVHIDMTLSVGAGPATSPLFVGEMFPNPVFAGNASVPVYLTYSLETASQVLITVHDVLGRRVRTLDDYSHHAPGRHTAVWDTLKEDGEHVPAGVYHVRIEAGAHAYVRSVIVR